MLAWGPHDGEKTTWLHHLCLLEVPWRGEINLPGGNNLRCSFLGRLKLRGGDIWNGSLEMKENCGIKSLAVASWWMVAGIVYHHRWCEDCAQPPLDHYPSAHDSPSAVNIGGLEDQRRTPRLIYVAHSHCMQRAENPPLLQPMPGAHILTHRILNIEKNIPYDVGLPN